MRSIKVSPKQDRATFKFKSEAIMQHNISQVLTIKSNVIVLMINTTGKKRTHQHDKEEFLGAYLLLGESRVHDEDDSIDRQGSLRNVGRHNDLRHANM